MAFSYVKNYGIPENYPLLEFHGEISDGCRAIASAKLNTIRKCQSIRKALDQIEFRMKKARMDGTDSELIMGLQNIESIVNNIDTTAWEAAMYGMH